MNSDRNGRAKARMPAHLYPKITLVIADLPTEYLVPQKNVMFTKHIWSHRTIF